MKMASIRGGWGCEHRLISSAFLKDGVAHRSAALPRPF